MKKTLIALAVAASAAVSGSAMAWTPNGTGGSVDLGGTLTPVTKATPWEVKVGDAVTGLDAKIQKGQKVVDVAVNKAIPVLGIRTQQSNPVLGAKFAGSIPQISYQGKLNLDSFSDGTATVTLDVFNKDGNQKIGSAEVPLFASAKMSWKGENGRRIDQKYLIADSQGQAFFGGLPKSSGAARDHAESSLAKIDPEFSQHYDSQGGRLTDMGSEKFIYSADLYSSYYGSGVEQGKTIKITLDQEASGDAPIQWKASLPVTVTYM
ncbi:TPA: hypothetical protein RXU17_005108 [Escherichia coli]|nr:hypothetical protein [Escherichia coli]